MPRSRKKFSGYLTESVEWWVEERKGALTAGVLGGAVQRGKCTAKASPNAE